MTPLLATGPTGDLPLVGMADEGGHPAVLGVVADHLGDVVDHLSGGHLLEGPLLGVGDLHQMTLDRH